MQRRIMYRYMERRFMSNSSLGWWNNVKPAPKDPIFSIAEAFLADVSPNKINLGVGTYRDDQGNPVMLQCVRDAEAKIEGSEFLESKSRQGCLKLVQESVKLAHGENSNVVKEDRFAAVQALSGTGACRLFAEFQRRFQPESPMYLPVPTWSNHYNIWRDAQIPQRTFRYYHPESKGLHFAALMEDVKHAPDCSFFLLHPCAHNPTGVDPTEEQWRQISYQFKVKNHFPFFDMAYQGFASGDIDRDARAIRIFREDGHLLSCAQSFAKTMGLYGQRVGCLTVLCEDAKQASAVKSQLQHIVRAMYSNPPVRGALLVSAILSDPDLKALWVKEVKVMANRICSMRASLRKQIGMFCFSGLTPEQIGRLMSDFHIYVQ